MRRRDKVLALGLVQINLIGFLAETANSQG